MRQFLEQFGLTKNEILVYEMLLAEGTSLAGKITQKTGIHRRNVYDCLERLLQKGLVGYIQENHRNIYSVTDPHGFQTRLEDQQRELDAMLPTILAQYHATKEKKGTQFYRGAAGIRQVLQDQLTVGKEVLVLATSVKVGDVLRYFFPKYELGRKEKRVPTRMLFDESFRPQGKQLDIPLAKLRYVKELNKSPVSQYIYGDNVAIVVWSESPIAILIRERTVAQSFRDNFELLWKLGRT